MANRAPISTPFSLRWRELCQGVVPYFVFAVVAGCAFVLWNKRLAHSTMVGRAEAVHTTVITPKAGVIAALKVDLLQRVKQGEVVAQLIPADLEVMTANLTLNVETLRAQLRQSADRNIVNYQELRLDWLRRNVELASARVEQQFAESEFQRYATLHTNHSVSDADFELRRSNRDVLQNKVIALERLSADLEKEIGRLKPADAEQSPTDRAISAAMIAQQKQLEALAESANLRAPIDGVVAAINKRPGENAIVGDLVVTVGALQPSRIVAYVRQPLNTQLKTGDLVEVTTRTTHRVSTAAKVLQVGTQLELIDPSLLPPSTANQRIAEYGLPVLVDLPPALALAPGEIVNLRPRVAN